MCKNKVYSEVLIMYLFHYFYKFLLPLRNVLCQTSFGNNKFNINPLAGLTYTEIKVKFERFYCLGHFSVGFFPNLTYSKKGEASLNVQVEVTPPNFEQYFTHS